MIWLMVGFGLVVLLFLATALIGAPYVPSLGRDVRKLIDELELDRSDVLVDIGSGDGVVLKVAAETGAEAVGYEINPLLVLASRWRLRHLKNVKVRWANAWVAKPLPKVTIIYVFGAGPHLGKIYKFAKRQANHQGSELTLVSYGFEFKLSEEDRPIDTRDAYYIYRIAPSLQRSKHKL